MQRPRIHRTLSRRCAWPLTAAAGALALCGGATNAWALPTCNEASCPAGFIALASPQIQASAASFKFQARISQAKLPVDDVEFPAVIVKLREANQTWCRQTLENVRVRDSVLNIEVGPPAMSCNMPLEEVIASRAGLGFQICINNEENCLKPISLSSVPYSVKAEFARRAQQAFEADTAAQCHYAHRVAADRDLLAASSTGTGYFDFHTSLQNAILLGAPITNQDGMMQWVPVGGSGVLNVCKKADGGPTLERLEELRLFAKKTQALGELYVSEATTLLSTLDVSGAAKLQNTLDVTDTTTLGNSLTVAGPAQMDNTLDVALATTLGNTLDVTGATTLAGPTRVNNTLDVASATTLGNSLDVAGLTTLSGGLIVGAETTTTVFHGPVRFESEVNIAVPVGAVNADTLAVSGAASVGSLIVEGTAHLAQGFTMADSNNDASAGNFVYGRENSVAAGTTGAMISGGGSNQASGEYAVVSGGFGNVVSVGWASIGGGASNQASGPMATVGGGESNHASGSNSTVAGGDRNQASGTLSTVGGGEWNQASEWDSTVGGGERNQASGVRSTVGGGKSNQASGEVSTVGGGSTNVAAGYAAAVPGGSSNQANGNHSFAAGYNARAENAGCFVWSDAEYSGRVTCDVDNRWVARASGGFYFYTNRTMTTGMRLAAGSGTWANLSDRNQKHDVHDVDPEDVVAALERLPVSTWRYKSEEAQPLHMGPMAQDFYKAFGLGDADTSITTIDGQGVALAAIKGVHSLVKRQAARIEEQGNRIDTLSRDLDAMRAQNQALDERLARLEARAEPQSGWRGASMFGGAASLAMLGVVFAASRRRKAS